MASATEGSKKGALTMPRLTLRSSSRSRSCASRTACCRPTATSVRSAATSLFPAMRLPLGQNSFA